MNRRDFSTIKRKIQHKMLRPVGFSKGRQGLYFRRTNNGFVGVELQTSDYADEFFVNLTWTLAGMRALTTGEPLVPGRMVLLDFACMNRLETLSRVRLPPSWAFDGSRGDAPLVVQEALIAAVATLDEIEQHFAHPTGLLAKLPPDLIRRDFQDRLRIVRAGLSTASSGNELIRAALHGFLPDHFALSCLLLQIAIDAARPELARGYLSVLQESAWHAAEKQLSAQAAADVARLEES